MAERNGNCLGMLGSALLIAVWVDMAVGQTCGEAGVTEEQCTFDAAFVGLGCAYGIGWRNLPTQNNTAPVCQNCDFLGSAAGIVGCISE
jgi:hypothetical protein